MSSDIASAGTEKVRTLGRLPDFDGNSSIWRSPHHCRVVNRTGDGSMIEFRSVVDAVSCVIEVQTRLAERNRRWRPLGDVVEESPRGSKMPASLAGFASRPT